MYIVKMTSVQKTYAQRDNRLDTVTLTGNISNNGVKAGGATDQNPAYAALDVTKSKNFSIDANILRARSDVSPQNQIYLLRIYISSSRPLSYYHNTEFDIIFTPPQNEQRLQIEIYGIQAATDTNLIMGNGSITRITNAFPDGSGEYSDATGVITLKVVNNTLILKSIPPSYSN